jgi:hypothetical protein
VRKLDIPPLIPFEDRSDFEAFALDHLEHFNAIPMEFQAKDGKVYGADACWYTSILLGINDKIKGAFQ